MKKDQIDYEWYLDKWKKFFTDMKFCLVEDEHNGDDYFACFKGFYCNSPEIIVTIYAGNYRTDTKTHGCIGIDFVKDYNKLSQMPIYVDLNEDEKSLIDAIKLFVLTEKDN